MKPGDTISKLVRVVDASGTAVTGLTLASNFTFTAYQEAYGGSTFTTYSASATLTEVGSGMYRLQWTLPAAAGFWAAHLAPDAPSSHYLFEEFWQGEVEAQDLDSIYGSVVTPQVTLTGEGTIGQKVGMTLVAYRWAQRTFTFLDDNGDPVDIENDYGTYTIGINAEDHTTLTSDATNGATTAAGTWGLTASSNVLTLTVPEDAPFFDQEPSNSVQPTQLYYEITANKGGDATQTVALVRHSPLTLLRREVGK